MTETLDPAAIRIVKITMTCSTSLGPNGRALSITFETLDAVCGVARAIQQSSWPKSIEAIWRHVIFRDHGRTRHAACCCRRRGSSRSAQTAPGQAPATTSFASLAASYIGHRLNSRISGALTQPRLANSFLALPALTSHLAAKRIHGRALSQQRPILTVAEPLCARYSELESYKQAAHALHDGSGRRRSG